MHSFHWLGLTALIAVTPLAAQTPPPPRPLTLAEARTQARRANPEIVVATHAVTAAAGRERQAGAWSNPTLGYSREQISLGDETNTQEIFAVEQRLELWGPRPARHRVARSLREAAEARLTSTVMRVDYEVAVAYAAAAAAERRATLADEAADAFARAKQVSEQRFRGGDVSGYQHRRLLLEAARYATIRSTAQVIRDSALRTLMILTQGGTPRDLSARPTLIDTLVSAPLGITIDSLLALALVTHPELQAAQREGDAARAGVGLAGAERTPMPTLTWGLKEERLATGESLSGFVAGASLPLPLWNRGGGGVAAAQADARRQDAEIGRVRNQVISDVLVAYEMHQALAAQVTDLSAQLGTEAGKARNAAAAAFAEGEIGLLEWLDAVRAYHEAASTYTTLWVESIARRAALERATGALLF